MATRNISAMELLRQRMDEEGRRPSFDSAGNVRGYRSRPGAPSTGGTGFGVQSVTGGDNGTPTDAWNSFFHKGTPVASASGKGGSPAPFGSTYSTVAPQLGQTNINPSGPPTTVAPPSKTIVPPPSNISLVPENPPDAAGMAALQTRPYSSPTATPSALYSQAAKAHSGYLGAAPATGGWVSPTQNDSKRIADQYGQKPAFVSTLRSIASNRARMDNSFGELL